MAGISEKINNQHYHLIGVGGIGMSGIAKLLLHNHITVSGSDLKETEITEHLKRLGANIFIGHNPLNISGADLVVYSSAIGEDNPEVKEAKWVNQAEALKLIVYENAREIFKAALKKLKI